MPQEPDSLLFAPTCASEVEATLRLLGRPDPAAVDRWLAPSSLDDLADRHPRSLSVGQRQRVAIAAVAVGDAPVLVLDEPTRGIDATSRHALEQAVAEHAAGGGAVVLATHDIELAARVATRVVVLGDGDVVADGAAREVLAGSLFAPQVLRVLPPFLTVDEVRAAIGAAEAARAVTATAPDRVPAPAPRVHARPAGVAGRPPALGAVYLLVLVIGVAAFLYPFWLPSPALPDQAHAGDAPLVAAVVGAARRGGRRPRDPPRHHERHHRRRARGCSRPWPGS